MLVDQGHLGSGLLGAREGRMSFLQHFRVTNHEYYQRYSYSTTNNRKVKMCKFLFYDVVRKNLVCNKRN